MFDIPNGDVKDRDILDSFPLDRTLFDHVDPHVPLKLFSGNDGVPSGWWCCYPTGVWMCNEVNPFRHVALTPCHGGSVVIAVNLIKDDSRFEPDNCYFKSMLQQPGLKKIHLMLGDNELLDPDRTIQFIKSILDGYDEMKPDFYLHCNIDNIGEMASVVRYELLKPLKEIFCGKYCLLHLHIMNTNPLIVRYFHPDRPQTGADWYRIFRWMPGWMTWNGRGIWILQEIRSDRKAVEVEKTAYMYPLGIDENQWVNHPNQFDVDIVSAAKYRMIIGMDDWLTNNNYFHCFLREDGKWRGWKS